MAAETTLARVLRTVDVAFSFMVSAEIANLAATSAEHSGGAAGAEMSRIRSAVGVLARFVKRFRLPPPFDLWWNARDRTKKEMSRRLLGMFAGGSDCSVLFESVRHDRLASCLVPQGSASCRGKTKRDLLNLLKRLSAEQIRHITPYAFYRGSAPRLSYQTNNARHGFGVAPIVPGAQERRRNTTGHLVPVRMLSLALSRPVAGLIARGRVLGGTSWDSPPCSVDDCLSAPLSAAAGEDECWCGLTIIAGGHVLSFKKEGATFGAETAVILPQHEDSGCLCEPCYLFRRVLEFGTRGYILTGVSVSPDRAAD